MLSALLGSIFALMGVFEVVMRFFERISETNAINANIRKDKA
jgi:hypothetical protein